MGLPFILAGIVVKEQNTHFRTLRNRFEPAFHKRYDDYTQYVPLAATWGLKAAGVQGRSSWGELAVSNAFSAVLMAGMVNGLKYTVREWRPDHSTRNSFPSGHTATAFLCTTILHKEYGMKSPWYSIGGYTLAGLTGVTRQLNNRHWIGDVLVGAGIGILSADLGYFLSDLIFKPQAAARKRSPTTAGRMPLRFCPSTWEWLPVPPTCRHPSFMTRKTAHRWACVSGQVPAPW